MKYTGWHLLLMTLVFVSIISSLYLHYLTSNLLAGMPIVLFILGYELSKKIKPSQSLQGAKEK